MYISHNDHNNTIQVYSVAVMTHIKVLDAGQSSQGTSEPITPVIVDAWKSRMIAFLVISGQYIFF